MGGGDNGQQVLQVEFEERAKDFRFDFQTPVPVCRYMASLIPAVEQSMRILEPTPGVGNLVAAVKAEFKKQGRTCDVVAPEDYFLIDQQQRFDCVVMNPPFSSKSAFLENAPAGFDGGGMKFGYRILTECMRMSPEVIALMPWFTISDSDTRLRSLKRYGMKSLTALPRKTFKYARIQTVVMHLSQGYTGSCEFKVFDF